MNIEFKKLIDQAISKNVIVYDEYARSGEYTRRLDMSIIKELGKLKEIPLFYVKDGTGAMKTYYLEKGGSLPPNKHHLVLAISENHCLFGAY